MGLNQNPNNKKERQTGIIDDVAAIAMIEAQSQQGRRGGGKKTGTKGKQGFNLSKAQNAGVSKPKPKAAPRYADASKTKPAPKKGETSKSKPAFTSATTPEVQFYEESGLRIPLFDKSCRKKMHAKDGSVTAMKYGRSYLLGIIKDYAGEEKAQEFESAKMSKKEIGTWIQAAETKAFGNGPAEGKDVVFEGTKVDNAPAPEAAARKPRTESEKQKKLPTMKDNANFLPAGLSSLNGANKRKHDDEVTNTLTGQLVKKPKPEPSQAPAKPLPARPPHERARPQQNQNHTQNTQTRPEPQPIEQDMAPPKKPPQSHETISANPQPNNQGNSSLYRATNAGINADASKITKPSKKPKVNDGDKDLYIPKTDNIKLPKDQQHPLIPMLNLNPHWGPTDPGKPSTITPTRHLHLPGQRTNAIITAESNHTVHITDIPYMDTKKHRISVPQPQDQQQGKQPETPAPYLKPGPHGYNYATSSDESLKTGIGHQVEPVDESAWEHMMFDVSRQSERVKALNTEIATLVAQVQHLRKTRSEEPADPELERLKPLKEQADTQVAMEKKKLKELEENKSTFMREYRAKYPGTTVNDWPCGCQKVGNGAWEEGDSEEE
ncbi:hypothetical protein K458DRAFT_190606 [Lentithecium fluviatile CBS 122367]|uniref:Uncharacterized protein n=1 Tax=Lentithecium fluviatile CBS 122367 TaxID=1168545 RepID=A0A6G1JB30_9PLEO|nr:hypothetical protein K458DRAFT_190606 [Lentithecium fluviatile CBS 122367]